MQQLKALNAVVVYLSRSSGVAPSKCNKYTLYRWAGSFLLAFFLCIVVPSSPTTSMERVCPLKRPSGRVRMGRPPSGKGPGVVGRAFSEPNPHLATGFPNRGGRCEVFVWLRDNCCLFLRRFPDSWLRCVCGDREHTPQNSFLRNSSVEDKGSKGIEKEKAKEQTT